MIPHSFDIATLLDFYRSGGDPRAVLEEAARRLDACGNPGIFISRLPAAALDRLVDDLGPFDSRTKPLWGVPFAVKDNIDLAGLPTTAACPGFAYQPAASAEAVRRLVAAGAIPLGKTNLDQFATGLVGLRTPYPAPRNSFDPAVVPGGSSSGSAIAVARGLVSFALGTDTAGSGRVPAGLNNLVGLKPSLGAVPVRGLLPACQTLDCISVFALLVDDAWTAYAAMHGFDEADPWSRRIPLGRPGAAPRPVRIGVPDAQSRVFLGDQQSESAFDAGLDLLLGDGHSLVPVDLEPFFETASLLYDGAWVAERYQAIRAFVESRPEEIHPTTLAIIRRAERMSAADAFAGIYRLAALRRRTEAVWAGIDMLAVPTYPRPVRLSDIEADPIGANATLGTYTNFVNLLDLCALAVPGPFRQDGFPAGVTLIGPSGADAAVAAVGAGLQRAARTPLGATGVAQPIGGTLAGHRPAGPGEDLIELAVVGAHLSGLPLNRELVALGATFARTVETLDEYALYALPDTIPPKPGLVRTGSGGSAIATEVWRLSPEAFGRFVAAVPAPLVIGTVMMADGSMPKGFLCEPGALRSAEDVSRFGGWKRYLASQGG